jgi:hypothetical protein
VLLIWHGLDLILKKEEEKEKENVEKEEENLEKWQKLKDN